MEVTNLLARFCLTSSIPFLVIDEKVAVLVLFLRDALAIGSLPLGVGPVVGPM